MMHRIRQRLALLEAARPRRDPKDQARQRSRLAAETLRISEGFTEQHASDAFRERNALRGAVYAWAWSLRFDAKPRSYQSIRAGYATRTDGIAMLNRGAGLRNLER